MQQGADKHLQDSYGDFPMVCLKKESYCERKLLWSQRGLLRGEASLLASIHVRVLKRRTVTRRT
jgi:hypothetical protein